MHSSDQTPLFQPAQFDSPLEETLILFDNGEVGLNIRSVCGYWLYQACLGNAEAIALVLILMQQPDSAINKTALLQRCQQGEDAAIQQAIALMATQVTAQFEQALDEKQSF